LCVLGCCLFDETNMHPALDAFYALHMQKMPKLVHQCTYRSEPQTTPSRPRENPLTKREIGDTNPKSSESPRHNSGARSRSRQTKLLQAAPMSALGTAIDRGCYQSRVR
jgi:hypothetical protein